ncbi:filamentous hemagglutinin N-terminal domain-containing protein [Gilliamella sp. B3172]|uniref:two-partner secretion domain-containing protein n=1 Tax=Gilliamella sp. B3172 TaxID=2818006 RepID=UPI00226ADFB1|nr:filamentous hemagglutinin N-terminal domain-containing protein [Gilliamella sp. B3172]MCX8638702.1 filamentous hemagglutinin N-terminal domain-containing protein [Gilliamella sp. B3172]
MNKNLYRIVFNQARGLFVVVSEIVKSHQAVSGSAKKTKSISSQNDLAGKSKTSALKPLVFLSYVALGLVSVAGTSYASNIVVDKNASQNQRPNVHQLGNGATQIDIASPTSGGVSHNKFNQFDVSKEGVILNNSRNGSNTQLGGAINGNQSLTNSAKIILNEVNSKNPSQLQGYVEVAGQKAQVVIANTAGITCNGCGFINADRATLTTGKPIIENGSLKGYDVQGGKIEINGKGYRASGQDYTDLISRSVSINAELWTDNQLNVVTGKNKVSADLSKIEKQGADSVSGKPEFGVDVSALGGMYANKIKMVGTELGVGVRNNGKIWTNAGEVNISAEGQILNQGSIDAAGDIVIKSVSSGVENQNYISSRKGSASFASSEEIKNNVQGVIKARENINFNSGEWTGNDGLIEAGQTISSQGYNFTNGLGGTAKAKNIQVKTVTSRNTGDLYADNEIKFDVDTLSSQGKIIAGKQVSILAKEFFNSFEPALVESENILLQGVTFRNEGSVNAKNQLTIKFDDAENYRQLFAGNKVSIVANRLINRWENGNILAKDIDIKTNEFKNYFKVKATDKVNILSDYLAVISHGIIEGENVDLEGHEFNNQGQVIAKNNLNINITDVLNLSGLTSGNKMSITSEKFVNRWENGQIFAKDLDILADSIENYKNIKATDSINMKFEKLTNIAMIYTEGKLNLEGHIFNNEIDGNVLGDLINIDVSQVKNVGKHNSLTGEIIKGISFINYGLIKSKGYFESEAFDVNNGADGRMVIDKHATFTGESLHNEGAINVKNDLTINTKQVVNWKSLVSTNGSFNLKGINFENGYGSKIETDNTINIDADLVDNFGVMEAPNLIKIKARKEFYNRGREKIVDGVMESKVIDIETDRASNDGKMAGYDRIIVKSDYFINNWFGNLESYDIKLSGNKFMNYGSANAKNELLIDETEAVNIGKLNSDYLLTVKSNKFKNAKRGIITAGWQADFSGGIIQNDGLIQTGHAIDIDADDIINDGLLKSDKHLRVSGGSFFNREPGKVDTETVTANVKKYTNKGEIKGNIVYLSNPTN